MLNLNIGDVVYHAGKKRAIEAAKSVAGRTFFKLSGHAYMVRLDHVKPVIRLTAGVGYAWRPYRAYFINSLGVCDA